MLAGISARPVAYFRGRQKERLVHANFLWKKMICAFRNPFIKPCSGAMLLELLCELDGRVCGCDSTVEGDSDRLETVR
jgi:hypothetical protein